MKPATPVTTTSGGLATIVRSSDQREACEDADPHHGTLVRGWADPVEKALSGESRHGVPA